jgi:putative resolvase
VYVPSRIACEKLGVHPNTLRKWAESGDIKYIKTKSGQRRYKISDFVGENETLTTVCYCRVSSPKQKDDLYRQIAFMKEKYPESEIIKDVGSGINFKRKGLKTLLERSINGDKLRIVVAHKDRLCRFGFDLIEWVINRNGGKILVLKQSDLSPEQELTNDLLTILHVFSCRMHGLRSYKNKIAKAFANKGTKKDIQKVD